MVLKNSSNLIPGTCSLHSLSPSLSTSFLASENFTLITRYVRSVRFLNSLHHIKVSSVLGYLVLFVSMSETVFSSFPLLFPIPIELTWNGSHDTFLSSCAPIQSCLLEVFSLHFVWRVCVRLPAFTIAASHRKVMGGFRSHTHIRSFVAACSNISLAAAASFSAGKQSSFLYFTHIERKFSLSRFFLCLTRFFFSKLLNSTLLSGKGSLLLQQISFLDRRESRFHFSFPLSSQLHCNFHSISIRPTNIFYFSPRSILSFNSRFNIFP